MKALAHVLLMAAVVLFCAAAAPEAAVEAPDIVGWIAGALGPKAAKWITFIAFLIWLASEIAALVNGAIAWAVDHKWRPPAWVLKVSAILNLVARNSDKAWRFLRGYRGPAASLAPLMKGK